MGWFALQGNALVDAGRWRNPGGEFGNLTDADNLKACPGVGLRFIHKQIFNAIFRIDYGVGITPGATQGCVSGLGSTFNGTQNIQARQGGRIIVLW